MTALSRWWFAPAPARRLATLRVLVGAYALSYVIGRLGALVGTTRYPAAQFAPVGPVSVLEQPLPAAVHMVVLVATVLAGAAFVAGWRYRASGPAFALLLLWVLSYRNSWGMVFHTENLLVLHVWAIGLGPAAAALAWDARGRPPPADSGRYGWPIRLMCATTVLVYVMAGYAKLHTSGIDWAFGDTLRGIVAYDNVRKAELGAGYSALGGMLVRYDWIFPPLAATSLALELGAPVALLTRRVGMAWAVLAWSFHLGVLLTMYILFHYQLLGFAYASFFPVEKLSDRVERWWSRRRQPVERKG